LKKPDEKLVFYGRMNDDILEASHIFGENKEMFMAYLDEAMERDRQKIIYLMVAAFLLQ